MDDYYSMDIVIPAKQEKKKKKYKKLLYPLSILIMTIIFILIGGNICE